MDVAAKDPVIGIAEERCGVSASRLKVGILPERVGDLHRLAVVARVVDVRWCRTVSYIAVVTPNQHFHSVNAHRPQTNNITNTDDPDMDSLIDAYRNSLDEEERSTLSRNIQAKNHEIGAFVPTFMVPYVRHAYWRWWKLPPLPGTKHSNSLFDPFSSSTGGLFWYDSVLHEETKTARKKDKTFQAMTNIDETYKTEQ